LAQPLRIAYLLEDTSLSGGGRVVLAHADLLTDRGHDVVLVTKGPEQDWRETRSRWCYVDRLEDWQAANVDFVVGTFWTTLDATWRLAGSNRGVHLCQGYEGSFTAYRDRKADIDRAYSLPLPKITVSPHLVEVCRQFHADVDCVGQVVDPEFFGEPLGGARVKPRVVLVGASQIDFKGVDIGYRAAEHARRLGARFDLVRVSPFPPEPTEPSALAEEFHVGLKTAEMANLLRGVDAFLGPSRTAEGFGLPAAESMASGVPTILTRIPSFLSWNPALDHALFVDEDDWRGMAEALANLLGDRGLRDRLSTRGRLVVEQFRGERVAEALEEYFTRRRRQER
jgi:glycosyltransferase involved in cell wall biosynthesis